MLAFRIPEPEAYRLTRGLSDAWALRSYYYSAMGSKDSDRKLLAVPIANRPFFTGQATHEIRYATVDAALLAAEREVLHIHPSYCCSCKERRIDHVSRTLRRRLLSS